MLSKATFEAATWRALSDCLVDSIGGAIVTSSAFDAAAESIDEEEEAEPVALVELESHQ